ncbi:MULTISPECIES: hypothetical protein [unclassified Streptomyces]|uniref:hypothetical protein n=1 Tax=unclassified Streptomyces TaxID=2593676 RepID=UPI001CB6DBD3|nr:MULTISPECIES: hypothetical protein [unclassified Streptomyces]
MTPARPMPAATERSVRVDTLAGEDTVLVRPYVLAAEERALRRSAVSPQFADAPAWFMAPEAV